VSGEQTVVGAKVSVVGGSWAWAGAGVAVVWTGESSFSSACTKRSNSIFPAKLPNSFSLT
jgi:hypothetical protein